MPPTFTGDGLDPFVWTGGVTAVVNSTLTLTCPAEAIPPPVITWYRDGQLVVFDSSRMMLQQVGYCLDIGYEEGGGARVGVM